MQTSSPASFDRSVLLDRFRRMRARTQALFDLLDPAAYYERPIQLRNPIVFYEGHLPAFAVNTLLRKGLGQPGIDEHLETIFARGIDPEEEAAAVARGNPAWPARDLVRAYANEADRRLADAILHDTLDRSDRPLLVGAQALWTILEHEEMHQETLAYIWHEAPYAWKQKPEHYRTVPPRLSQAPAPARVQIPAGMATLGTTPDDVTPFAWDNERPSHRVAVGAFEIDVFDVTNGEYMAFVDARGYQDPRWWRDEDWAWVQAQGLRHPHFWEQEGTAWFWRGMFRARPVARELAGVRHMGRGARVRGLAWQASSHRGGVSSRRARDSRRA